MKKRILTAFLTTVMAVSVFTVALVATAIPGYVGGFLDTDSVKRTNYEYGTFSASPVIARETETLPFVGAVPQMTDEGDLIFVDVAKQKEISYAAVPVGAVLSAVPTAGYQFAGSTHTTMNYFAKNSGGAFAEGQDSISLQNGGISYTIPATSAGKLIAIQTSVVNSRSENPETFCACFYVDSPTPASSSQVTGTTQPTTTSVVAPAATGTCKSNTGRHLNIKTNDVYQFKVTSLNGKQPTFNIAGSSFKATLSGKRGSSYLYLAKAVGKAGQYGDVYINDKETVSTTISIVK